MHDADELLALRSRLVKSALAERRAYSDDDPPETVSRALLLRLDTKTMTCSLVRSMPNPDGALTIAMGNAQLLADGGVMVGWGTTPTYTELLNYRAFRHPWTGEPDIPPAVAGQRNADGTAHVYVSWNGATQVARWRVLGGRRRAGRAP